MAIETTSTLTNSIRARYINDYLGAALNARLYDMFASPVPGKPMAEQIQGSSVYVPFLASMNIGTTAISETADVTPQVLADALASISPTSRGEALQCSEKILIQAYTDYGRKRFEKVGENMMVSVDLLAQDAAVNGNWVERAAARASLDAGTTTHYLNADTFAELQAKMLTLKVPGFTGSTIDQGQVWPAVMHPYNFHDLRVSDKILEIGEYQDKGVHLNFELGKIGPFRLVVSPFAKVFMGAGSANASAVSTTLAADAAKLATTITVAATANMTSGEWIVIGTAETGSTLYPENERVKIVGETSTSGVFTIIGEGDNGGLKYAHASGTAVSNADSVYTVVVGGPASLAKLYAPDVGEFGQVVGPKRQGLLDQFISLGWKFYGGYGRISESWILRGEFATSFEA